MSTLEEWWTPYPQAPLRCITRKNKTLYVQREGGCMNSTHDLLVFLLPFGLLSYDNDIVAIPYPSDENNLSIQHERFAPSEVKIRFPRGIDEVQRVEVVTTGRIVDANYLVPTECSLISYDPSELKILKLSDKSGCGLNSVLSSFQRHFTTTGMIFSANINLSAFIHLASPRLQCSLVPCGDKCLENREFCQSVPMAFTNKMVVLHRIEDTVLNRARTEKVSPNCHFLWERLFLSISCFLLSCTTSVSWIVSNKLISRSNWIEKAPVYCAKLRDQIFMLKHKHFPSRVDTSRVQIVHPMDTFNCPPIVTTESVVSIRRKFSKLTEFKKTSPEKTNGGLVTCDSPATTEHLNVNELSSTIPLSSFYVCPSLIDALPDPPRLSVQGLVDMHRKMTAWKSDKEGKDNLIASNGIYNEKIWLRGSLLNKKKDQPKNETLTYASLPPIPPRDSSVTVIAPTPTPRFLSSRIHETIILPQCGIIESGNEELLNTTKLLKEEAICDKQLVSERKGPCMDEASPHSSDSLPELHFDHIPIEKECEFNTLDGPMAKHKSSGLFGSLNHSNRSSSVSIRCNEIQM